MGRRLRRAVTTDAHSYRIPASSNQFQKERRVLMGSLALFFIGSVLLLNGLGLLNLASPLATAPINAIVGLFTMGTVLVIALPATGADPTALPIYVSASGFLLFAVTYLYVALNNFFGLPSAGLGWYCGWAVPVSLMLAAVNFLAYDNGKGGWLWLSWAGLFGAFFATGALGLQRWVKPTGIYAILHGFFSTGIPGALQLTGFWDPLPVWVVAATQIGIAVVFAAAIAVNRVVPAATATTTQAPPPARIPAPTG